MNEFEARLSECLEAVREGRWDIDECLRRYPQHAAALRPHLLIAVSLSEAYGQVKPRARFAAKSRERFLLASEERLREAFDADPSPSFFASARVKFLMAAQRMKLGERTRQPRRWPVFGSPFRTFASAGAALVLILGFSTYTVASADAALPGDWQYPVKLQTERVRLALARGENAEHDVQLDIAGERASEIEKMQAKGRIIGPGVLDRLADDTRPLVEAAANRELDRGELERLKAVTERQVSALAQAEGAVAGDAQPALTEARLVSTEGVVTTAREIDGPIVVAPPLPLPPVGRVATPEPTDTPESSPTPEGGDTPAPQPTATPAPARDVIVVEPVPVDSRDGIIWVRLAVNRFSTLIPSEKNGWRIIGVNTDGGPVAAPSLVRLANLDSSSLITLNPRNGDMYWFVAVNGVFDEVQMRMTGADGATFVADPAVLRRLYGTAADVPLFMLENIVLAPEPTPTPQPTAAP